MLNWLKQKTKLESAPDTSITIGNSYFLRRILAILLGALILWSICTGLLYSRIARPLFIQLKQRDILPQVRLLAQTMENSSQDRNREINYLINLYYQFYGSTTYYLGADDQIQRPLASAEAKFSDAFRNDLDKQIRELASTVQNTGDIGSSVYQPQLSTEEVGEFLLIATPIKNASGTRSNGTLVMMQPLNELNAGIRSLNIALLTSGIIVAFILFIPSALIAVRLVSPLTRMRKVALAMTQGNFSLKASEEGTHEIADLGRAMNLLADRLSATISELTHERNQLQEIIESIAEGIMAVSEKGEVTLANKMMWRLFHRDPALYDHHALLKAINLQDLFLQCMQTQESVSGTIPTEREVISYLIAPLRDGKNLSGAVGLFRDITQAERLEQTRREYVANVSHELRTPITAMRGLLEPLHDGMVQDPATQQRYYSILLRESIRLSHLIDDMLELSRLQSGSNVVAQRPINLQEILVDLAFSLEMHASEQAREFTFQTELKNCPPAWGNAERIEQIIYILFDNAIKFTEPETGHIELQLCELEDHYAIKLIDNGSGISLEDLPHIFDRFYKADKAHNERGTGLGLSIARELANRMHMTLSVTSAPGEGATFCLQLPFANDVLSAEKFVKDA